VSSLSACALLHPTASMLTGVNSLGVALTQPCRASSCTPGLRVLIRHPRLLHAHMHRPPRACALGTPALGVDNLYTQGLCSGATRTAGNYSCVNGQQVVTVACTARKRLTQGC